MAKDRISYQTMKLMKDLDGSHVAATINLHESDVGFAPGLVYF